MKQALLGIVLLVSVAACSARPTSVTLIRVDGGFMTCTTFIQVDGGAP